MSELKSNNALRNKRMIRLILIWLIMILVTQFWSQRPQDMIRDFGLPDFLGSIWINIFGAALPALAILMYETKSKRNIFPLIFLIICMTAILSPIVGLVSAFINTFIILAICIPLSVLAYLFHKLKPKSVNLDGNELFEWFWKTFVWPDK